MRRYFFEFFVSSCLVLTACATSDVPSNFVYDTSLRNEQGWIGASNRTASAETLLSGGVVTDPTLALQAALPEADIRLKRWGMAYFSKDWKAYQAVLDADIRRDGETVKCRMRSPEDHEAAPSPTEMRADNGAVLQRRLTKLVQACAAKVTQNNPA